MQIGRLAFYSEICKLGKQIKEKYKDTEIYELVSTAEQEALSNQNRIAKKVIFSIHQDNISIERTK